MTIINKDFEFHELVSKVEERFRPELDKEARERMRGTDTHEGKYEPKEVSTGWWVVLKRFGVAIRFGDMKPDIEAGDTLILVAHVQKKKPDAPELAIVPPAPPPIGAEAARRIWLESLPPEQAAKIEEAIAVVSQGTLA